MRRTGVVAAAALATLSALGCEKTDMEKVPAAEVDQAHKAIAEQFGTKIMLAWAKNEYPTVGPEAMDEFQKGHNDVARQKAADKAIEDAFGDFKSMTFHEALRTKPPKFEVYRFKGTFVKGTAEVRVTVNTAGKIAGHFVVPWKG